MEVQPSGSWSEDGDTLIRLLSSAPVLRHAHRNTIFQAATGITVGIFLVSSFLLITNPDRATLIERPTQSATLGLFVSGLSIIAIHALSRASFEKRTDAKDFILLADDPSSERANGSATKLDILRSGTRKHLNLILLVVAFVVRVHVFEHVLQNLQCSWAGVEGILPIIIAKLDSLVAARTGGSDGRDSSSRRFALLGSYGPAVLVSWANIVAAIMDSSPRSTTICAGEDSAMSWTFLMQFAGVCLDSWLLHSFHEAFVNMRLQMPSRPASAPFFVGLVYLLSAIFVPISGLLKAIVPQYRAILSNLSFEFVGHVLWASLLFVLLSLSATRVMYYGSSLKIVLLLSAIVSCLEVRNGSQNIVSSLEPRFYFPWTPPLLLLFLGLCLYLGSNRLTYLSGRPLRNSLYTTGLVSVTFLITWTIFGIYPTVVYTNHPIEDLMKMADQQQQKWVQQASTSQSLEEAVQEYLRRYRRYPPPGFDKWYEYATERSSLVIDDYDMIEDSLRPFWNIEPKQLRTRTKLLLSDTANDCAEVSIRSGNVSIGQVVPTHRWMVEGVIKMIEPFKDALPDMDIAFNINDEPRVAIPFSSMGRAQSPVMTAADSDVLQNKWSDGPSAAWNISSTAAAAPLDMDMHSFRKIWRDFGSIACPPDSPARRIQVWDSSVLCTSCYKPHSMGPFMGDWTLAGSPCHQPDLALLHGFYLGPSAFKGTHEPLPIFSQSRAGGFADILYPSAWNYNDKVKYEPSQEHPDVPFEEKENTLFWRGGTTEGFSQSGQWKGSTRQRLVDTANNSTLEAPVLLPSGTTFKYQTLSVASLQQRLAMSKYSNDVGFVSKFPRCDNGDCESQHAHFGLAPSSDFQDHWKHRFLLDADGAGFSGRFLSFLQSHSLPVKTAIFREWYDDRVIPWKHFVPIDIRLHGLWSTMAYFATNGFRHSHGGRNPGEEIAEAGRDLAGKYLRKEDMEIYFFRLLLEYGRLTDDQRNELGYTGR